MQALKRGAMFFVAGLALVGVAQSALAGGPYQYFAVTPCRVADTRSAAFNSGAFLDGTPSLQGTVTRALFVKGMCGVPATATAVSLNATVVNPTSQGWLALWPANTTWPGISTLNFTAGAGATANGAVVPLSPCASPCGDLNVMYGVTPSTNSTDLIIDVTGYFQ